jgi:hypothetical protein
MKSKRATKATGARISCSATAMKANTHEIPKISFVRRLTPAGPVSSLCLLRQVSSLLSRNCRNEPRRDQGEAWVVTPDFMARQLHECDGAACQRSRYMEKE